MVDDGAGCIERAGDNIAQFASRGAPLLFGSKHKPAATAHSIRPSRVRPRMRRAEATRIRLQDVQVDYAMCSISGSNAQSLGRDRARGKI